MKKVLNIAIDGPAGAGKSTIARLLAQKLGILYLDTGAMYRAIGLKALRTGTDMRSETDMGRLLGQTSLDIRFADGCQQVLLDGEDVSQAIRTPDVSRAASDVSALPVVRLRLVALQRRIAAEQDLVLDGRDIGTYVLPQARYKFFLTADVHERARRRLLDLRARGDRDTTLEQVLEDVIYRDRQDSERKMAPLRQADDAILLDSTGQSIEETIESVLAIIGQGQHE
ncbi:MAG: (d)CMP kinase [Clostridiaceae bacterium]|jgi:cytidylate kinase|nr:(d)CMP kinase [Clostridiaceae bacterium]